MANQGNDRNREGNLGQPSKESSRPTGTSGRQDREKSGEAVRRNNADDDDDSPLGTRNTNR